MRGSDQSQPTLFITRTVEDFVPADHPLRGIRKVVDEAMLELDELFSAIYAQVGRDSIAPERLLRASLLQILFTLRSERQLVEHIRYNLLYRWFVGLEMDDAVWHHSTFSKNRERLIEHKVVLRLFESVLALGRKRRLISEEHFSVDGSLIEAWASQKSFRRKDGNDDDSGNFHGQSRSNKTHRSTTDSDSELMRKSFGKEAKLSYGLHQVMENRSGLVVGVNVTASATVTERDAALDILDDIADGRRKTLGGDKGYDVKNFVQECRERSITLHAAQSDKRKGGSALDGRTTRHPGYAISQIKRKLIETTFGWLKQYGGLRRMMYRGMKRVSDRALLSVTAFNILRLSHLEVNV